MSEPVQIPQGSVYRGAGGLNYAVVAVPDDATAVIAVQWQKGDGVDSTALTFTVGVPLTVRGSRSATVTAVDTTPGQRPSVTLQEHGEPTTD